MLHQSTPITNCSQHRYLCLQQSFNDLPFSSHLHISMFQQHKQQKNLRLFSSGAKPHKICKPTQFHTWNTNEEGRKKYLCHHHLSFHSFKCLLTKFSMTRSGVISPITSPWYPSSNISFSTCMKDKVGTKRINQI